MLNYYFLIGVPTSGRLNRRLFAVTGYGLGFGDLGFGDLGALKD